MKRTIIALTAIAAFAAVIVLTTSSGCTTTTSVSNGVTNKVTIIDPVKIQQVSAAITPAASSVLRRAILRSPQHAQQIDDYARAVGNLFCNMRQTGQFDPGLLLVEANKLTGNLQTNLPPEVIDAKNSAIALYQILYADKLTVQLPTNAWPYAVSGVICDSISQALADVSASGTVR